MLNRQTRLNSEFIPSLTFWRFLSLRSPPFRRFDKIDMRILGGFVQLTYTRGSPIPLKLTLACTDLQTLELFSPASMSVHLVREVAYDVSSSLPLRCGAADPDPVPSPSSSRIFLLSPLSRTSTSSSRKTYASSTTSMSVNGQKISPKLSLRHARKVVASAVWWESHEMPPQGAQRGIKCFDGEILLPRDIPPSFTFGGFSVKVCVATHTSFRSSQGKKRPKN